MLKRSKGASILLEILEIVKSLEYFKEVSFDTVRDIEELKSFPVCFVSEEEEIMEFNEKTTIKVDGYDRYMKVNFYMALDMKEPTEYKDVQEMLERAILDDTRIWKNAGILDRDVLSAFWDRNDNFQKNRFLKQGVMQFQFRYRIC